MVVPLSNMYGREGNMKAGTFLAKCKQLDSRNYSEHADNCEVAELARYTKAMFKLLTKQVARNIVLEREVRRLKEINQLKFRNK